MSISSNIHLLFFVSTGADDEVMTHLDDLERKATEDLPEDINSSPNLPERTRTGQHNNSYQIFVLLNCDLNEFCFYQILILLKFEFVSR